MIVYYNAPGEVENFQDELNFWLQKVARTQNFIIAELAYTFMDDEGIRESNQEFLAHDYPTDIITFDYTLGKRVKAEMLIGIETIRKNSEDLSQTFSEELDRVLVHGLLHCMGFDDKDPESKIFMREEENKSLILRPKKLINR